MPAAHTVGGVYACQKAAGAVVSGFPSRANIMGKRPRLAATSVEPDVGSYIRRPPLFYFLNVRHPSFSSHARL